MFFTDLALRNHVFITPKQYNVWNSITADCRYVFKITVIVFIKHIQQTYVCMKQYYPSMQYM